MRRAADSGGAAASSPRGPDLGPAVERVVERIGRKVEQCRREAGLGLNQLAQLAGVSPAAVHKIEKKEMTPSITVLMKIARALHKSVSYFTEEGHDGLAFSERLEVSRRVGRRVLTSPSGARMEPLGLYLEDGQLEACIFSFGPEASSGAEPRAHQGEELFLVMQGEMTFFFEGERHLLGEGDSVHFKSDTPHRWINSGASELRFLWIMTPLPLSSLEPWIPRLQD